MLAHELVSPYNESTTEEESAMADQLHLDRLRQGVSTWNVWMAEQRPNFQPDLRGADLSEADLQYVSQFKNTKLQNVKGLIQDQLETYKKMGAII